jgi:hypothetical protein
MSGYINEIKSQIGAAESAAAAVATATAKALSSVNPTGSGDIADNIKSDIETTGTTNVGAALSGLRTMVGLDGSHSDGLGYVPFDGYVAELHEGERVLTADENQRYMGGADYVAPPDNIGGKNESPRYSGNCTKKIELDINGSGGIDVTGMDENTVVQIIYTHIKPTLLDIISQEMFEEGDSSHGF